MKIVVMSDSHGKEENIDKVIAQHQDADMLIHLGDICGDEDYLEAVCPYPVIMVAGNCDSYMCGLPGERIIDIAGKKCLLTHGHSFNVRRDRIQLAERAKAVGASVAMYGHTHVPEIETYDEVLVLNPGSVTYPRQKDFIPTCMVIDAGEDGRWKAQICRI